jgi:copper transport protein
MMEEAVRFLHLLAAATWVGGLITLGALVPAVRRAGGDRALLRAMARRFGQVSWTAMAVAVATGLYQLTLRPWSTALSVKTGLVGLVVVLAGWHQAAATRQSPALRGALQGLILLLSVGIVAAAVAI